jgi:hypothetical protein
MPDITLVRQQVGEISEADKEAARRVIFGIIDGLGQRGQKQWRKLWNWIWSLEPGEIMEISTRLARSGPFHRRHFKMEQTLFESQERFEHFDQFIYWIKVGAGWVTWAAGPKGGVVPIPRSVSYAKADQEEFEDFHQRVVAFLRGPHAAPYLWPHLKDKADGYMHEILGGFGE